MKLRRMLRFLFAAICKASGFRHPIALQLLGQEHGKIGLCNIVANHPHTGLHGQVIKEIVV